MKKKTLWWIIGGSVGLLIILILIGKSSNKEGVKVAVEKVAAHTITETVTASGKIYPEMEVKISPEVSGEIIELTVEEGDRVEKGQMLVRINEGIYTSAVNQAKASVDETKARVNNSREMVAQAKAQYEQNLAAFNRNQQLYKDKVISSQEFEQAEAAYRSALASYDAAKANVSGGEFGIKGASAGLSQAVENLRKTTIIAPTGGVVSQLNVKKGERVVGTAQMAGTEMLTIADMSRMEVRVDVSETDIAKVKIGDTTMIDADAYRNRKFTGIVSKISVSSKSGAMQASNDQVTNYTVHILILASSYEDLIKQLPAGKFPFKPGMSASVEIQTKREKGILSVPVNAVTTRDWPDSIKKQKEQSGDINDIRQVVFVYNEQTKKVALREVKTSIQDNLYIQVLEGLKIGEQVVVAPYGPIARTLKNDTKVTVTDKEKLFETETKE